jgi:Fe-S-cluster containining protein
MRSRAERVMLPLYREVDQRIGAALDVARRAGVEPTCRRGCSHCCRQRVHASTTELAAIAAYVEREMSPPELAEIMRRIETWESWVECDLLWLVERGVDEGEAFEQYGPTCPLLVDDECSVYEVRPLVCRAHYVISDVELCRPRLDDDEAPVEEREMMDNVVASARPVAKRLRGMIEASGQDFRAVVDLLPVGLARALRDD